ncbi:CARDB domain-containing protein [Oceanicoccus sp. KOV_DT_Chl]|uniref:CARDB domain-containing protein n=1 Tax=Oceanicoccus sp. KOV_DT_Chl TaxID=1904639 RepID=UPI000C7C9DB4|nr:CARDB domain-containing protein [Oceanicoccus sp. KOV_DT_Chl]
METKKHRSTISAIVLLTLLGSTSAQAVQQVEYADMKRAGANPVIVVTGQGNSYTNASSNKLTFHAQAKGRCTWANRYSSVAERLSKPNHQAQHSSDFLASNVIVSIHDGYKNKDRTWSSSMKPISISWTPDKTVRDAAVKSCNDKRDSLIKSGNPPQGRFQGTALVDQVMHQFSFECSTLVSLTPNQVKNFSVAHPIAVQCEKLAPIQATLKLKPTQALPMKIKHLAVVANPKNYSGVCPVNMTFKGTINTEGPGGEIHYRFLSNGKAITGFKSKTIAAGQVITHVSVTQSLDADNTSPQQGKTPKNTDIKMNQGGMQAQQPLGMAPTEKVTLEVRHNNQKRTAEDKYVLNCQQLKVAQLLPDVGGAGPELMPDMTSRQGIKIGQKSSNWGGQITLKQSDFTDTTPRGCLARFSYDAVNIGKADASGFNSRMRLSGKQLHLQKTMDLNKNQSKNISGQILLPAGKYPITASIDDSKAIDESNENNNIFKITVTVPDSCGGGMTPRPSPDATPAKAPRPRS